VRLPTPCLVVLVGPSGAGKSQWATAQFRPEQIVSSDALRALVGDGADDQRAGTDAFAVLDDVLARRLRRRLTTVVDTLGLDAARRAGYVDAARRHNMACVAIAFDVPAAECRARNRTRTRPVPERVLASQLRSWPAVRDALANEGFDAVHAPGDVQLVPAADLDAPDHARNQREDPMTMGFGLQVPAFSWPGGPAEIAPRLAAIARAADDAGFDSLWVMDHFLQIPQVGRPWDDMLESYTTLGFLAGLTERIGLGVLVTGVTYRNLAHLAKIVATLDVLSGGRARCGLGAAWYDREHVAYGWRFPPTRERYALLEDALRLLPVMWGPGTPAFEGKTITVAEAACYPRPVQARIPIIVGGSGEKKTLRLAAELADGVNLFGDAATVRHKVGVLHAHCADVDRDPSQVAVTHLSTALVGRDRDELDALVAAYRGSASPEAFAARANAAIVDHHVGRFRALADAGVSTAMVSFPDLGGVDPVERFAPVIAAFRRG
jgi:F420-dependent oxidoreductase-like protein